MKESKREKLNFIINNAEKLKIEEKRTILNLLMLNLGIDSIHECADGCRIIINKLSKETIDDILIIMAHLG